MNYELSQHARDVLAERGISSVWLECALYAPQLVAPDAADSQLEHRLAVIAENGGRVLRVVLNKTVSPIRIVTVYFDRTMKGRL